MIAHAVYIGVMASFACSAEPCLVSAVAIADHIARGTAHPGGAWNRGCTVAAAKPAAHRGSMIAVAIVVPIAVVVSVVVPATIARRGIVVAVAIVVAEAVMVAIVVPATIAR